MTEREDRVDAVIQVFLDHLEGTAERPSLDHLTNVERGEAEALIASLEAARGIDPYASRPSIERLLAGTAFEGLLHAHDRSPALVDVEVVRDVLVAVDGRARVEVHRADGLDTLMYSILDLRARFVMVDVDGSEPFVTAEIRSAVEEIFSIDPDTTRVGVVATGGEELITQMLAASDFGRTITAPSGATRAQRDPTLPLSLAVRRMLEQYVPQWDQFDFEPGSWDAVDIVAIAAEIASRLIVQESARRYQGEKRRAYQSLLRQEGLVAELVESVFLEPAGSVDLDAEVTKIERAAA